MYNCKKLRNRDITVLLVEVAALESLHWIIYTELGVYKVISSYQGQIQCTTTNY